jgi:hypothetical protein
MRFEIGDQVVMSGFGVGQIVGRVTKSFLQAESQLYYKVSGKRSTMRAPVNETTCAGYFCHPLAPVSGRPRISVMEVAQDRPGNKLAAGALPRRGWRGRHYGWLL